MKTSYTRHAWTRVLGRLSLSPAEVADILDWRLCVDVGLEPGTERIHRVFFSVPDRMCFVAVQDTRNGAVITVLPIDFHETLAWPVSDSVQAQAEALATGQTKFDGDPTPARGNPPRSTPTLQRTAATDGPRRFRLMAYSRTADGQVRVINLGSWPFHPYEGRVELLLEDDSFFSSLNSRLVDRGVLDKTLIECVYVRVGNNGTPVRVTWTD